MSVHLPVAIAVGAGVCFLGALPIVFDKHVPAKGNIVAASTLRGVLVALLVAFSISAQTSWAAALGYGVLFGLLSATVVVLSKESKLLMHAKYMLPSAAVTGALIGVLILRFAF
jgi:hypothetical protein